MQHTGSAREYAEAEKHKQVNFVSSTLKELVAVPLAIEKVGGSFFCTVYLAATDKKFTNHIDTPSNVNAGRFGRVKLISEGSNMTLLAQGKIFLGMVNVYYDDPQGLNRIPDVGAVGHIKRHPDLASFDWDDLGNPIPGENRKKLTEVISRLYQRHDALRIQAPEGYSIPPAIPRGGIIRELYLDGLENPSSHRVNSVSQEWALMKRGLKRAAQPQKTVEKIKEGWEQFGMMEQLGGEDMIVRNEGGVEFFGMNKGGSSDGFVSIEHKKLDPNKVVFQNKRFNTFLKHYASTSIRPIRQWVNSIADLEEGTIRALATVFSIGGLLNKLK